jgi:hypothetical protein
MDKEEVRIYWILSYFEQEKDSNTAITPNHLCDAFKNRMTSKSTMGFISDMLDQGYIEDRVVGLFLTPIGQKELSSFKLQIHRENERSELEVDNLKAALGKYKHDRRLAIAGIIIAIGSLAVSIIALTHK